MRAAVILTALAIGCAPQQRGFTVDGPEWVGRHAERHYANACREFFGRPLPVGDIGIVARVSQDSSVGYCRAAFCNGHTVAQTIIVVGSREYVEEIIGHESAHAAFHQYFSRKMRPWFSEGAACWFEPDAESLLTDTSAPYTLRFLLTAPAVPTKRGELLKFYGQAYSFSTFLIETYGMQRFIRFGSVVSNDLEGSSRTIYNRSLQDLENEWRNWHGKTFPAKR